MAGLDLTAILSEAANYTLALVEGNKRGEAIRAQQASNVQSNVDVIGALGANSAIIESAKVQGELAVQQARIKGANAFGTNLKEQSEIITALAADRATAAAQKKASLDVITQKQSVGITDDPLTYILNQLTINDDIARHNAANAQESYAADQIVKINALTQTTVQTQNMLSEGITAASAKAAADNVLLQAAKLANDEKNKALEYNIGGIQLALNTPKELLALRFQVFGAQKAEQQMAMALETAALQREKFSWDRLQKEKGEQSESFFIDQVNKGRQIRLGPEADLILPGTAKAANVVDLIKSNSEVGQQFRLDYNIGSQGLVATSPAQAQEILNTIPVRLNPSQGPVKDLLDRAAQETVKEFQQVGKDLSKKAEVSQAVNAKVKALLEAQAKLVNPGDSSNIFSIPNPGELIANSPVLQALPVIQKVIAPVLATGVTLNDPNQVFGLVAKAVQNKTISYNEALELTTLYHVGVGVNMSQRKLGTLGITPPAASYNATVDVSPPGLFNTKSTLDFTKADAVSRALSKYLSENAVNYTVDSAVPTRTVGTSGQRY